MIKSDTECKSRYQFLVIEDDLLAQMAIKKTLNPFGEVLLAHNVFHAKTMMANFPVDMAFIDLKLGNSMGGFDLIEIADNRGIYPVVLSGYEEQKYIEDAYRKGCRDYLVKPFADEELQDLLKKFDKKNLLKNHNYSLDDPPVLLVGETGTGKSRMARQIHRNHFKNTPFVEMACAEIPEDLLESELFGFEKGAFSGADKSKPGRLELADGGVLFLDEVATMPLSTPRKILKAIEEKKFFRLGGVSPREVKFFLVSATCEDLDFLVKQRKFRRDLYYRLEGNVIKLNPLRRRKEELFFLIEEFLKRGSRRIVLANDVWQILYNYNWPGNIRELSNTVEVLRKNHRGIITVDDLPDKFKIKNIHSVKLSDDQIDLIEKNGLKYFFERVEEKVVIHFLNKNNNQIRKTTRQLKLANSGFYKILGRINEKKNE
ncbi:MAG: sigma 54-interacting transcriptional regulator [Halobacteriovoraceae bacterium]|nr:sigma 54-interacting transcriptional regulator [Halobacteriovoraceae bacterium]